jgi:hypothetical protein
MGRAFDFHLFSSWEFGASRGAGAGHSSTSRWSMSARRGDSDREGVIAESSRRHRRPIQCPFGRRTCAVSNVRRGGPSPGFLPEPRGLRAASRQASRTSPCRSSRVREQDRDEQDTHPTELGADQLAILAFLREAAGPSGFSCAQPAGRPQAFAAWRMGEGSRDAWAGSVSPPWSDNAASRGDAA